MVQVREQLNDANVQAARLWLAVPEAPVGAAGHEMTHSSRRAQERARSHDLLVHTAAPARPRRSLSHSGGSVAVAIAPAGCAAGVDLESVRPRDVYRLAQFAFAPSEVCDLRWLAWPEATRQFYLLWTLKEAFAKALGLPLPIALRECSFTNEDNRLRARVPLVATWRAAVFEPRPALMLAAVIVGSHEAKAQGWICREWPGSRGDWRCLATLSAGDDPKQA